MTFQYILTIVDTLSVQSTAPTSRDDPYFDKLLAMTLPTEIIPSDASTLLDTSKHADCLLLDCRTEEEYSIAKIAQSKLIPMQEIPGRLDELEPWKQKRLVVHCHHGVRSLRVAKWLREHGFDNAQSLKGGIEAWRNEIDSSIPAY